MPSSRLTIARNVLPCDTTSTFSPRESAGASSAAHHDSRRLQQSASDSLAGTGVGGMPRGR
eukprot:scaffold148248_cov31-Tisochrysis_lutea.AAC.4